MLPMPKTLCVLCALRAFAFTRSASLLAWRPVGSSRGWSECCRCQKRFASFAPFAPLRLPALRLCLRGVLWARRAGGLNAADAKNALRPLRPSRLCVYPLCVFARVASCGLVARGWSECCRAKNVLRPLRPSRLCVYPLCVFARVASCGLVARVV